MRIVAWNIRAGGGRRVHGIADQLRRWRPDIVTLSEFRGTPPSRDLAACLRDAGLVHQRTTVDPLPSASNALLLASRWPIRMVPISSAPDPARWLLVRVAAPRAFYLGSIHAPNMVTGKKYPFLNAVHAVARTWSRGPALFLGDTNSGRMSIDEESPAFTPREEGWIDALEAAGWPDAFRRLHPRKRAYTWYSPNAGNGFRLDQAFPSPQLLPRVRDVRYRWGSDGSCRRDALSDHAAMLVDMED